MRFFRIPSVTAVSVRTRLCHAQRTLGWRGTRPDDQRIAGNWLSRL